MLQLREEHTGRVHQVTRERSAVGRALDCEVRVDDPTVGRHHCDILLMGQGWLVRDAGSANGVLLDGGRVREAWLTHGAQLTLGRAVLTVDLSDENVGTVVLPDVPPMPGEGAVRPTVYVQPLAPRPKSQAAQPAAPRPPLPRASAPPRPSASHPAAPRSVRKPPAQGGVPAMWIALAVGAAFAVLAALSAGAVLLFHMSRSAEESAATQAQAPSTAPVPAQPSAGPPGVDKEPAIPTPVAPASTMAAAPPPEEETTTVAGPTATPVPVTAPPVTAPPTTAPPPPPPLPPTPVATPIPATPPPQPPATRPTPRPTPAAAMAPLPVIAVTNAPPATPRPPPTPAPAAAPATTAPAAPRTDVAQLSLQQMAENETSAIDDTRNIMAAQTTWQSLAGRNAGRLACLGQPLDCGQQIEPLLDRVLTTAATRNGYVRRFVAKGVEGHGCEAWAYVAYPEAPGRTGEASFCGDSEGRVCYRPDGGAITPVGGACPVGTGCTSLD